MLDGYLADRVDRVKALLAKCLSVQLAVTSGKQMRDRRILPDRHNLDLDCIRDHLPVLVASPSRQPIASG